MYEYNYKQQAGCPATYSNNAINEVFTKNDCLAGYIGSKVAYTIPAGKYTSSISQTDVDQKVQNELNTNGQAYANTNGNCIKLYYNTAQSQNFIKENCPIGSIGGTITYTVPASKYFSTVDTATANQIARDEIKANGQAFANNDPSVGCMTNTNPAWEGTETAQIRCQKDGNGNNTGHQEVYMTDVNPNSSTRNSQAWKDAGPDEAACPPNRGSAPSLSGTGYQTSTQSGVITGQPGATITVTVTLNSSDAGASLTGYAGVANIQLSGSGNKSVTNILTIPDVGYLSWKLTLSGDLGTSGGYISSNIRW